MPILYVFTLALALLLLAISLIDARTQRIPDWLNLTLALLGLSATYLLGRDLLAALIGVAAGFVAIWLVAELYLRLRGHDGLGGGDAKFLAAAGAWVGWNGLPFVVLLASALGIVFVALLRLTGRTIAPTQRIAFGPFLSVGLFAVWFVLSHA